jgi:hypothetical protein
MSFDDELEIAEECHRNAQCEDCGGEVDNPDDGCECPCHDYV